MKHATEPYMLVMCSEMIELIEAWEKVQRNFSCKSSPRFAARYQHAFKRIRKFNRQTLVN